MLFDPKWEKQVEAKPLEPWRKILLDAADIIERHGLGKTGQEFARSPYCAVNAISKAGDDYFSEAHRRFAEFIGAEPDDTRTVFAWNDAPERTKAEVIDALRRCASPSTRE